MSVTRQCKPFQVPNRGREAYLHSVVVALAPTDEWTGKHKDYKDLRVPISRRGPVCRLINCTGHHSSSCSHSRPFSTSKAGTSRLSSALSITSRPLEIQRGRMKLPFAIVLAAITLGCCTTTSLAYNKPTGPFATRYHDCCRAAFSYDHPAAHMYSPVDTCEKGRCDAHPQVSADVGQEWLR